MTLQYRLIPNKLANLYITYNVNYEVIFIRIAREMILQSAGGYEAQDYWVRRAAIGENMRSMLNDTLFAIGAEYLVHCHARRCVALQLLKVGLPETYENQIVLTQVEVQKRTMKTYEQSAAIIRAQIQVDISEYNRTIVGILSSAASQSFLIKQNATVRCCQLAKGRR